MKNLINKMNYGIFSVFLFGSRCFAADATKPDAGLMKLVGGAQFFQYFIVGGIIGGIATFGLLHFGMGEGKPLNDLDDTKKKTILVITMVTVTLAVHLVAVQLGLFTPSTSEVAGAK